jgi:hypothetical protein
MAQPRVEALSATGSDVLSRQRGDRRHRWTCAPARCSCRSHRPVVDAPLSGCLTTRPHAATSRPEIAYSYAVLSSRGSVKVALTRTRAFNHAEHALTSLRARITRSDLEDGFIEAKFPWSWRSPGEIFTVRISGVDGAVLLEVSSRLRTIWYGFMDFGKNADNLRRFVTSPVFASSMIESQSPY